MDGRTKEVGQSVVDLEGLLSGLRRKVGFLK